MSKRYTASFIQNGRIISQIFEAYKIEEKNKKICLLQI